MSCATFNDMAMFNPFAAFATCIAGSPCSFFFNGKIMNGIVLFGVTTFAKHQVPYMWQYKRHLRFYIAGYIDHSSSSSSSSRMSSKSSSPSFKNNSACTFVAISLTMLLPLLSSALIFS